MSKESMGASASAGDHAASPLAVTVVVVADYDAGDKLWANERAVLDALAAQDFLEPFEVILCEHESQRASVPPDIGAGSSGVRLEFLSVGTSAELKDEGARRARADLIAVLEADCVPAPDWLRLMVTALRAHPEVAAVSGKTMYPGTTPVHRCLSLLDRGYLDPGGSGQTQGVSNNSAIFRRTILTRYPYPSAPSPFLSASLRLQQMHQAGLRFFFESRAVVHHALPHWQFVRDMRHHSGFALWAQLQGGITRVLYALIRRLYGSCAQCVRLRRHYGVRWYELPLALGLAIVALTYEIQGIRHARGGRLPPGSAYR